MLQFIPVAEDNMIAIRATGKLSHEDYQQFLPKLESRLASIDKVSVLFELDDFRGWELEAAKDDFKFGMSHKNDFERIALVGDKPWERWMALLAKPFMPGGEIRYFDRRDLQQAWDWLRQKKIRRKMSGRSRLMHTLLLRSIFLQLRVMLLHGQEKLRIIFLPS